MNLEELYEKMLEQSEIHGDVEDLVMACAKIAHDEIKKAKDVYSELKDEGLSDADIAESYVFPSTLTPEEEKAALEELMVYRQKKEDDHIIRFTRWCINVGYIPLENGLWGRAGYNPNYRLSDSEVLNQWNIHKSQNP